MPRMKTFETGGDIGPWLASAHGIRNARTCTIDTTAFSEKAKNGVIPSGTPVTVTGTGTATPYAGTGAFNGFILTDQPADGGKIAVPVLDHGRVYTDKLPGGSFTAPEAADDKTTFVYVTKEA